MARNAAVRLTDSSPETPAASPPRKTRKVSPGSSAERMLVLLVRPMSGRELAQHLDVSRERIRQLVLRHMAQGRVRIGDESNLLFIVARHDDPSLLLMGSEVRILSALPDAEWTHPGAVARAAGMRIQRTT